MIDAAQELQLARRAPAHQVARAVDPGPGRAEGIGNEPLRRQVRPAQVAARQAGAADQQLARHPHRHRQKARSTTWSRVLAIGGPSGTGPSPGATSPAADQIAVSVGP